MLNEMGYYGSYDQVQTQNINSTHKNLTDGDSHHAVLISLPYSVIRLLEKIFVKQLIK